MIGIGVIGYGYWGPNLVRNFSDVPGCRVVAVSDMRSERLAQLQHGDARVHKFDFENDPVVEIKKGSGSTN